MRIHSIKSKKKTKIKDGDDPGTVIANMNVDGMPWYTAMKTTGAKGSAGREEPGEPPLMTRGESWRLIMYTVGAALLIGLVFIVAALLFILFCLHVWLK
ncbi:MAG: hypothetical protein VB070_07360 [Clostridiaceae bacterium]|nr:hypothetical protein [Clostridiaceae bacterium]